ncbi:MAG: hypothetical protein AAF674_04760 [Pseudomonadota bacterium]
MLDLDGLGRVEDGLSTLETGAPIPRVPVNPAPQPPVTPSAAARCPHLARMSAE